MKIKFWGTRGSIPVPGEKTIKYGGNTPCIQISGDNNFLIVDAGTGIKELGKKIIDAGHPKEINILITHSHWDHIQGLPFFAPLFDENCKINIFSNKISSEGSDPILDHLLNPEFFPVNRSDLKAEVSFFQIGVKKPIFIEEFKITAMNVHHLNKALAFKIESKAGSVVYMPDNEIYAAPEDGEILAENVRNQNSDLIDFCKNADYLIHDCMYFLTDSMRKRGWGHSDNISLSLFAILCKIKNLVLFHYEPDYTDSDIDAMFAETKKIITQKKSSANVIAAKELLELSF